MLIDIGSWVGFVIYQFNYMTREIVKHNFCMTYLDIVVQSLRSDSFSVCAEWADETDGGTEGEDRGWTAGKQTGGVGGGQVAWLFTPRLADLDNGATAMTRMALSDSVSDTLSLSLCLSLTVCFSLSPFLFLSSTLALFPIIPSLAACPWRVKPVGCGSQNPPAPLCCSPPSPFTSRLLFFQTSGFKKSTAYWAV